MNLNADSIISWLSDHKASICSAGAIVGVFSTAYFSGKAAVRVSKTIDPDMDRSEKAKEYVKAYWKTGVSAAATCALIISSDRIHVGKEAAIAGVAAMWNKRALLLDKKLVKEVGEERAKEIHDELVQDQIEYDKKYHPEKFPDPMPEEDMDGKILVYEPYTDQYFYTTREIIAWVMLEANKRLINHGEVMLNPLIKMMGGKEKPEGNILGWNWDNDVQNYNWGFYGGPFIEISPGITKDGKALCLFYMVDPETQRPEDMIYSEETL